MYALEPFAVGAESSVVVDSARQKGPVDRLQLAVCGFFKIHNAESLSWIRDDPGDLRRPLRKCTDSAKRGDIGTSREKSKEGPAAMVGRCESLHDVYLPRESSLSRRRS